MFFICLRTGQYLVPVVSELGNSPMEIARDPWNLHCEEIISDL